MNESTEPSPKRTNVFLLSSGLITALIYAVITWLSYDCEQSDPQPERPLLTLLMLFTVAGIIYLTACWMLTLRRTSSASKHSLFIMIGWAIVFRLILMFSIPIQEVDLYRYIWDGVVTAQAISPYKYSPEEVELRRVDLQTAERIGAPFQYRTKAVEQDQVTSLARLADGEDLAKVFRLLHFKEYTTPYPPTNQPFFALAAVLGQLSGQFYGYLFSMKGILILFDIGTGLVLIQLLARLNLPQTWSVAWFWCPLVLKEIANSGHLDSIAVFFTTLAIWLLVVALWPKASDRRPSLVLVGLAFVVLAVAVAAKIYPLVLFPLFFVVTLKRLGASALVPAILFPMLVAVLLWPILSHLDAVKNLQQSVKGVENQVEPAAGVENQVLTAPPPGIEAFARHWEMNDFLFMLMVENLKPYGNKPDDADALAGDNPSRIWFVRTSNEFRHKTAEAIADAIPTVDKRAAPFWLTRMATLGVFSIVVLWACVRLLLSNDPRIFLEIVFLTIAWFWLLAPTQNPWYWTWAVPMLCFCRNPAWYLFAVTSLAYYLRFYCEYHLSSGQGKYGTPFKGTALFDFNVPILEFAPLLVLLFVLMLGRMGRGFVRRPATVEES